MQNNTLSETFREIIGVRFRQGFAPLYHGDVVNHCPACGHTHWHIGRMTAECAFCETALPLDHVDSRPMRGLPHFRRVQVLTAA